MSSGQNRIKSADITALRANDTENLRTFLHNLPNDKGVVFGLIELSIKNAELEEKLLHIIASHLEHLASSMKEDGNPARRFEQMLASCNDALHKIMLETGFKKTQFHGILGILSKNQLFLSGTGQLIALFLHKTADRRYSVYELNAQFETNLQPEEKRLFITILDGETHPGDVFYIGTPFSERLLKADELHDILVTLPPNGSLARIKQFIPAGEKYGALAFNFQTQEEKYLGLKKTNPIGSLEALQVSQDQTANVLGESNKELSNILSQIALTIRKSLTSSGVKGAGALLKRSLSLILNASSGLIKAVSKIAQNILPNKFLKNALSTKNKFVFLGLLVSLFFFTSIWFLNKGNKENTADQLAFQNTVSQIEEKITKSEASLIYRNTEEARNLLKEAAAILETLPQNTVSKKATAETLTQALTELEEKIRGIVKVSAQILGTLETNENFTAGATINGRLYAITDNLTIYRLDGLTNSWIKEDLTSGALASSKLLTPEGNNLLVVDEDKNLGRADLTNKTLNPVQSGTKNLPSVNDIVTYGGNLYALSAGSQQIVKMRPQGTAYEGGTPWITSLKTDLGSATSLAIDGDVYILNSNGSIIKLRSGKEIDWVHETIDPILKNPLDLWTDISSKYLYILDPGTSRIIVFNKESGAVETQYTHPELKNAIGFIVEETNNRIVFVSNNQALAFTALHLVK